MEKWILKKTNEELAKQISEELQIHPLAARIITNRGIDSVEAAKNYLYADLSMLHDPFLLTDLDKAIQILKEKKAASKAVRIIGDYDVDGIMSSYILLKGFEKFGIHADVRIPDRKTDGYGLNTRLIREAFDDGIDTIVTCDNGISASGAISLAKELGMTVIVTDHHEVISIPDADAVIDPKRDDTYPCRDLCGASVAWKLIRAIGSDQNMQLLQFAAIATICDVVPLVDENRIIVREGLKMLHETNSVNLRVLAQTCHVLISEVTEYHIGFVLGPCLNACGRLGSAMDGLRFLTETNFTEIEKQAEALAELNKKRKDMTEEGLQKALQDIEANHREMDRVLVVYIPEVEESVIGIIAGRIKEMYHRPTFVLTDGDSVVKGSGRSIEAYSIIDALSEISDLFAMKDGKPTFGGHRTAAGISLPKENIEAFRNALNAHCKLAESDLEATVEIDAIVPIEAVTEDLVEGLNILAPFGQDNPKPILAQQYVKLSRPKLVGLRKNVLKMTAASMKSRRDPVEENEPMSVICFHDAEKILERISSNSIAAITYEPQINEFMGQRNVQIVIDHVK
ncbi:MAG: single-stranded-DNA-specific exonuclease RecJ [Eubacteriales bacterium]|nr:single-stranded-DNA-specific exonuclease RecJ [Eubacteriales bacterium]